MFRSEIGSGFEDPGGTPPPRIPRSTPSPPPGLEHNKMENKTFRPVILLEELPVASFPVRKNALVEFPVSSADQFEG